MDCRFHRKTKIFEKLKSSKYYYNEGDNFTITQKQTINICWTIEIETCKTNQSEDDGTMIFPRNHTNFHSFVFFHSLDPKKYVFYKKNISYDQLKYFLLFYLHLSRLLFYFESLSLLNFHAKKSH